MSRPPARSSALDRGALRTVFLGVSAGVLVLVAPSAANMIAIPAALAILGAIVLAPAVRWQERSAVPAWLGAALVVGALLPGASTTAHALAPSEGAGNDRAPQDPARDGAPRARDPPWCLRDLRTRLCRRPNGQDRPAASPGTASSGRGRRGPDGGGWAAAGGRRRIPGNAADLPSARPGDAGPLRDVDGPRRLDPAGGRPGHARPAHQRTSAARYLPAISAVNLGLGLCIGVAFHLLGVANASFWGVAAALLKSHAVHRGHHDCAGHAGRRDRVVRGSGRRLRTVCLGRGAQHDRKQRGDADGGCRTQPDRADRSVRGYRLWRQALGSRWCTGRHSDADRRAGFRAAARFCRPPVVRRCHGCRTNAKAAI